MNTNNFETMLNNYWQMVYRFVLSRTANEDLSRDICGQVFLTLCEKQPSFHSLDAMRVWLIKTARYVLANERRLSDNQKIVALDENMQIAVNDTLAFEFCDVVSKLPAHYRDVTVLYYIEDMSISDIAKALSIARGTVKSRLSRARDILKKTYKEEIL